jgi:hypothetical protein
MTCVTWQVPMLKSGPSKLGMLSAVSVFCFLLYQLLCQLHTFEPVDEMIDETIDFNEREVVANIVFLCLAALTTLVMLRLVCLQAKARVSDTETIARMEKVMANLDRCVSWIRDGDAKLPRCAPA